MSDFLYPFARFYQASGCRNLEDNFWGDIPKASVLNLQKVVAINPRLLRYSQKGRQTMIRRLFVSRGRRTQSRDLRLSGV
jgi:hypothetical protein